MSTAASLLLPVCRLKLTLPPLQVLTATVDLEDVSAYRGAIASRGQQSARSALLPRVRVPGGWRLCTAATDCCPTPPLQNGVRYHSPEEEIAFGPACWMWDYLLSSYVSLFACLN